MVRKTAPAPAPPAEARAQTSEIVKSPAQAVDANTMLMTNDAISFTMRPFLRVDLPPLRARSEPRQDSKQLIEVDGLYKTSVRTAGFYLIRIKIAFESRT